MTAATVDRHPLDGRAMCYPEYLTLPGDVFRDHFVELLGGRLVVRNRPAARHQRAVTRLLRASGDALPAGLEVLPEICWHLDGAWAPTPDVMVVPVAEYTAFEGRPHLVVEVLSPSTRSTDLDVKTAAYARGGAAAYWVVDHDVPSVVGHVLHDGAWVEVARTVGRTPAELPFDGGRLTLAAADLVA